MSVADEQVFLDLVREILEPAGPIDMDTSVADVGADSLDLIELVTAVEERFDVFFDRSELVNITTPRQFYKLVMHHRSEGITAYEP